MHVWSHSAFWFSLYFSWEAVDKTNTLMDMEKSSLLLCKPFQFSGHQLLCRQPPAVQSSSCCAVHPVVQSVSCFSQGSCNFSSESLMSLERSSLVHLFLSCPGLTVYPMFAALTPIVPISVLASLIGSSNTLVYQFYPHPTEAFICSDSNWDSRA